MGKKRGAAHVEMVISFLFFTSFVAFLFVTLKPYEATTLTGNVVSGIEESFQARTQTNFSRFFLKTNDMGDPRNCFELQLPDGSFRHAFTDSHVNDLLEGGSKESSLTPGTGLLRVDSDTARSFTVLVSPEFDDTSTQTGCNVLTSDDYTLGSVFERQVVSYAKLQEMKTNYDEDYEGLKRDLLTPEVFEFTITSEDFPEINMQRQVPDTSGLIITQSIHEVLDASGKITNARFVFTVW